MSNFAVIGGASSQKCRYWEWEAVWIATAGHAITDIKNKSSSLFPSNPQGISLLSSVDTTSPFRWLFNYVKKKSLWVKNVGVITVVAWAIGTSAWVLLVDHPDSISTPTVLMRLSIMLFMVCYLLFVKASFYVIIAHIITNYLAAITRNSPDAAETVIHVLEGNFRTWAKIKISRRRDI